MSIIKKIEASPRYELTLTQTQFDKLRVLLTVVSDADLDKVFMAMDEGDHDRDYDVMHDVDACEIEPGGSVSCEVLYLAEVE